MIKYKKSLLSVAASMAIASTMLTADYLPLTTKTVDNQWVLFGVSGYQASGASTAVSGEFSIGGTSTDEISANVIIDDNHALGQSVGGLVSIDATTTTDNNRYLGYLDAISVSTIEARVNVLTASPEVEFLDSESYRTMYIDSTDDGASAPTFSFTYKASLEGHTLEYKVGTGQVNQVTISSSNTFNNPKLGVIATGGVNNTGIPLINLIDDDTNKNTVLDYDFLNNPPLSASYSADLVADDGNRDKILNATVRMYSYDAENKRWNIYDAGNTAGSNDFTEILKGKAYWGKIDNDGSTDSGNTVGEAGLILGNPDLDTDDYTAVGLDEGWNLIAFDDENSEIRHATTGLLVTLHADSNLTITDSSGIQSVNVTLTGIAAGAAKAREINIALESARLNGTVPSTFNLRAYATDTAANIALVSNKRFSVSEVVGDTVQANSVTTLTGAQPLVPSLKFVRSDVTELNTTLVSSAYGEYAMVIKPLVDAASVADDLSTFQISRGDDDDTVITVDVDSTAALTATAIEALDGNLTATNVDIDNNTSLSYILIADTKPFAIRDHTFTRVFSVDSTTEQPGTGGTISISGVGGNTATTGIVLAEKTSATLQAAAIVAENISDVKAYGDSGGDLYIKTNISEGAKFHVAETTLGVDLLTTKTSTDDEAQGAIDDVYSLTYLSKIALDHEIVIDVDDIPGDHNDSLTFQFTTAFGDNNMTAYIPNPDAALDDTNGTSVDNYAYLTGVVTAIKAYFTTNNISASAEHNYTASVNDAGAAAELGSSVITIGGSEILAVDVTQYEEPDGNETMIFTFSAGNEAGNDTNITFDGNITTIEDSNDTAVKIADAFISEYNAIAGRRFYATSPNGAGDVTLTMETNETYVDATAASLVISEGTVDTTTIAFDFNGTTVQGAVGNPTILPTITSSTGYLGAITADLSGDLKYNNVFTPDYVMNGPLYTMKDNGMTLKALITGSTQMSDTTVNGEVIEAGEVAWDSIDLTRKPSQWFDSQDYTLFSVDGEAGYWALLSAETETSLTISDKTLSKEYAYHFDGSTTYNHFSGSLSINIDGLSDADDLLSARATASFGGETIELTKSTSDDTLFTGSISSYESLGIDYNINYPITINIADGLGNNAEFEYNDMWDNVKPKVPDANITNGKVLVSANVDDTDVAGFYVFSGGGIPEVDMATSANLVGSISGTSGEIALSCSTMQDVAAYDAGSGLRVIAVDGTGELTKGNASDPVPLAFMTILKERVLLIDTSNGDVETTTVGASYDENCADEGNITQVTGVEVAAITDSKETKLAYTNLGLDATNAMPVTVYVSNGAATPVITRITYPETYVGQSVFVLIDGETYGYILPSKATVLLGGAESGLTTAAGIPVNLNTIDASNPKADITF